MRLTVFRGLRCGDVDAVTICLGLVTLFTNILRADVAMAMSWPAVQGGLHRSRSLGGGHSVCRFAAPCHPVFRRRVTGGTEAPLRSIVLFGGDGA